MHGYDFQEALYQNDEILGIWVGCSSPRVGSICPLSENVLDIRNCLLYCHRYWKKKINA